jgi:hypothetical protein
MSDLTDAINFPAHKPVLAGPNYNTALAPRDATPADSQSLQIVAQRLAERDEAVLQRLAAAELLAHPVGSQAYQNALDTLAFYSNKTIQAITDANAAGAQAIAAAGIPAAYISETTDYPPIGPNGTKGAHRSPDGGWQRLQVVNGVWVDQGAPLLTTAALANIVSSTYGIGTASVSINGVAVSGNVATRNSLTVATTATVTVAGTVLTGNVLVTS